MPPGNNPNISKKKTVIHPDDRFFLPESAGSARNKLIGDDQL